MLHMHKIFRPNRLTMAFQALSIGIHLSQGQQVAGVIPAHESTNTLLTSQDLREKITEWQADAELACMIYFLLLWKLDHAVKLQSHAIREMLLFINLCQTRCTTLYVAFTPIDPHAHPTHWARMERSSKWRNWTEFLENLKIQEKEILYTKPWNHSTQYTGETILRKQCRIAHQDMQMSALALGKQTTALHELRLEWPELENIRIKGGKTQTFHFTDTDLVTVCTEAVTTLVEGALNARNAKSQNKFSLDSVNKN